MYWKKYQRIRKLEWKVYRAMGTPELVAKPQPGSRAWTSGQERATALSSPSTQPSRETWVLSSKRHIGEGSHPIRPFSPGVEGEPFLLSKRGCLQNGEKIALRRRRWPETLEITNTSLFLRRYTHSQIIHRTLRNIYSMFCNLLPEKFNTLSYKYKSLHQSHSSSSPETPLCMLLP